MNSVSQDNMNIINSTYNKRIPSKYFEYEKEIINLLAKIFPVSTIARILKDEYGFEGAKRGALMAWIKRYKNDIDIAVASQKKEPSKIQLEEPVPKNMYIEKLKLSRIFLYAFLFFCLLSVLAYYNDNYKKLIPEPIIKEKIIIKNIEVIKYLPSKEKIVKVEDLSRINELNAEVINLKDISFAQENELMKMSTMNEDLNKLYNVQSIALSSLELEKKKLIVEHNVISLAKATEILNLKNSLEKLKLKKQKVIHKIKKIYIEKECKPIKDNWCKSLYESCIKDKL
ncbi:MAG: hypothetical protein DRG78_03345 [Epsilonproteobacteria bacterium]|nr:MAG: hypothetical protein DRG78_03345 [Campylobacterota bacterium]